MTQSFRWISPLGASVAIFLGIGFLWILIGALTVPLHNKGLGAGFVSESTDTAYFGTNPSDLLANDPPYRKLRTLLLTVIAGLLLLAGSLFVAIAWFALKLGQVWAVPALGLAEPLALLFWALALLPYFRSGIPVTLGDLPPFMWIPGVLIVPAILLGWIGLR